VAGKRFLFPCSDIAREEIPGRLREAGAEVERVVVYRTVTPPEDRAEHVRGLFKRGGVDVLIFASPSAVHNFVELMGTELMRETPVTPIVAAIGPTTAEAVRKHGLSPHVVAGAPDAASFVRALVAYDTYRVPE
jgi:uroporphyrinogen-III synthase